MTFDHEAHREHNKRIEEIDKKAGIGKYNSHAPKAKSEAIKNKKETKFVKNPHTGLVSDADWWKPNKKNK